MTNKLRAFDQKVLADNYSEVSQILAKIDSLVEQNPEVDVAELPNSLVPTDLLYRIAICYTILYDELVKYELIRHGNPAKTSKLVN